MRNLNAFQRFLEVVAISDGEIINHQNIEQDCGVSATTVSSYFDILEDTVVGFRLPAFTRTMKRRLMQVPKFYYFDVGIANHLLHRTELRRAPPPNTAMSSSTMSYRKMDVPLDIFTRKMGDIECLYVLDFFRQLAGTCHIVANKRISSNTIKYGRAFVQKFSFLCKKC